MNRNKNRLLFNLLVIAIAIIYFVVLVIGNVGRTAASVAVVPGSYGAQYAEKNHLNVAQLADSQKDYFDFRYELFDYSVDKDNRIQLENYSGQSTDLIIPSYIDGNEVHALSEEFIKTLGTVKNLYISNNTTQINGDADKTVVIHCYEDNRFYRSNSNSDWNFEIIYDSDFVNFLLGDIPFAYNDLGSSYEITQYVGNEDYVIIPSYINGYPVTDVSMDLLGKTNIVVIPDTVTSITGTSSKLLYSPLFAIELLFTVAAFVLALLTINVLLPRYSKSNTEYLLTGSQMVSAALYVLAQVAFSICAIYYSGLSPFMALVISVVIVSVFLLFVFLGGVGRNHAIVVSESVASKTAFMDALKESTKYLADGVSDPELKKQVQRLVEEIRYSDPVSNPETLYLEREIQSGIDQLKNAIKERKSEKIEDKCQELMKKIIDRNEKNRVMK